MKKIYKKLIGVSLILSMIIGVVGCSSIKPQKDNPDIVDDPIIKNAKLDENFIDTQMNFSVDLFRETASNEKGKNVMISPFSVMTALSIVANGADGETKEELEKVLGGKYTIEELKKNISAYIESLPSGEKSKLQIANALWLNEKDGLIINDKFINTAVDYYDAEINKGAFTNKTVSDINKWVKKNTDGMIDEIIKEVSPKTVMYVLNAIAFDGEWKIPYEEDSIHKDVFCSYNGERQKVDFMYSEELSYFDDGLATGFKKSYKGGNYSFVAMLPNEDVDIDEYVSKLTSESIKKTLENKIYADVRTSIPKFESEYKIELNGILNNMGLSQIFDERNANLTKLGTCNEKNIFVSGVNHKTFISVDEKGTKASAVTSISVEMSAAMTPDEIVEIYLNRPFVYMIIHEATNTPLFMGVFNNVE